MQLKKVVFGIGIISFLVISAVAGFTAYSLLPFGPLDSQIEIIISPKSSIRSIVDSLQQKEIIRSSDVMLFWLKITGNDRKIQAGKVTLFRNSGVIKATEKLLSAVALEDVLRITEGYTFEQIAGKIQAQLGVDSSIIVSLCSDSNFIRKLGVDASTLEGYLFPETYRFPQHATAEEILTKMVQQFKHKYDGIIKDSAIVSMYTCHQIVTIASIVEKEATLAEERTRISGVFHNRLKKKYPLGADPTVRYIYRKFSGPLRVSELNSNSPYNTRKFVGLPPGPICSPGLGALQAAALPLKTDDLFFVAVWDGSGAHDFSKTNAEHDRKKMLIRRQNEQRINSKK